VAIAIDPSTPAALGRVSNATPYTSASFSPPAGSLVFIAAGAGWSSPAASIGITCSDSSGGGNWERADIANGGAHFPGAAAVFRKYFATAPGAITVSVAYTNFGAGNCEIVLPVVFWGAHPDQSTAGSASDIGTAGDGIFSLTTTKAGSQVWGVSVDEDTMASWTPNANTILAHEFTDATNGIAMKCWASAANTVTPGATSFGGTWGNSDESKSAGLEIIPGPFPVVEAWASGRTTTVDTSNHAITLPAGIVAGQKLVVLFSCDGAPTCSTTSTGWVKVGQASNTTVVTGAVFEKIATGSDALTINTTSPEQSSHISARVSNAGTLYATSANGSSTNSNPPSLTPAGGSNDYLWLSTRSGDSTVLATVAPANFSHLQSLAAAGTSGASSNVAERPFTGTVLDPGTFTSLTEQWVSWTIAIAPVPTANEVTGSGGTNFGPLTGTATGQREVLGSASTSFSLTGTANGTREVLGSASTSFGGLTGTSIGTREVLGSASTNFGSLTGTSTGQREVLGSGSSNFGSLIGTANGTREVIGSGSGSFGPLIGIGFGSTEPVVTGSGFGDFGSLIGQGNGVREVLGSASTSFGFEGTASGVREVLGSSSTTFSTDFAGSGIREVLGSGIGNFGSLLGSGQGAPGITVYGSASTVFTFTGTATGSNVSRKPPTSEVVDYLTSPQRLEPDMPYRLIAQRIIGRTFIDWDLPVSEVVITYTLSGPKLIKGKLKPEITDFLDLGLEPKATFIHIEQDNIIRGSAILQPSEMGDDGSLTFIAEGLSGYPHGQPYQSEYSQVDIDPLDVVRHIWSHLLSSPRSNLGVLVANTTSEQRIGTEVDTVNGAVKPYTLFWWDDTDCGREIDNLAKETPFDYVEFDEWNSTKTDVIHHIIPAYPRIGTRRFDLGFVSGENITSVSLLREEPDQYASEVIVRGAGEGKDSIRGFAANIIGNRIRQSVSVTDKSITTHEAATKRAEEELRRRQAFLNIREITVIDQHENASLGDFAPGDDILVQVELYWFGEIQMWCRIIGFDWVPEKGIIVLQLENSEIATYGSYFNRIELS
jgi:hypothetical protein